MNFRKRNMTKRVFPGSILAAIAAGVIAAPLQAQEETETRIGVFGEYKDWRIICDQTGDVIDNCRMIQPIFDAEGNRVSQAEVTVLTSGDAVAVLLIGAPLETYLPAGVRIAIDDGGTQTMDFQFCAPAGCFATISLPETALDLFIKGSKAQIGLVPYANRTQSVVAEFSLAGFTAAFEQLEVQAGLEP